ncbi:MAG: metallophosphoesterase [Armatimonadota bacterium]|nr:metallophosphoesterase [Armatimonadota bacterium]
MHTARTFETCRSGFYRRLAALVALAWASSGVLAAAAPRLVRGPWLQQVTETSAVIQWETDQPVRTRLEYAPAPNTASVQEPGPARRHRAKLTYLAPETRYRYRVWAGQTPLTGEVEFVTAKPPGRPFRFAVLGDSGSGEPGQFALARRIAAVDPHLLLHTGDVVYPKGDSSGYDARFFRPYATLLSRVAIWPTLGNHDVMTRNGAPYLEVFELPRNGPAGVTPERIYAFDYADVHFTSLDSTLGESTWRNVVLPWLRRDLASTQRLWKVVYFHHPPYSSGLHGGDRRMQRLVVPLLSSAGVDLVFNGHDHCYERTRPIGGVTYVVTGAGGGGLYARRHPHPHTARFYNRQYSFTQVDVNGALLQLRQIAVDGSVVDAHSLTKKTVAAAP